MHAWISILFSTFSIVASVAQEKDDFLLVKKDGTIAVYERWITYPGASYTAREVKGEFYFENTQSAGLALLQDETRIKRWQSHVSKFNVHLGSNKHTWKEYSYHDIPWPVSDQDHFLEYRIQTSNDSVLHIEFASVEDLKLAPLQKGVTRMELLGSWTFQKIDSLKTKATYRIISKPLNIPKFLTDPVVRNNMMTTIKSFIQELEVASNNP
jgi:hypothetical protein